MTLFELGLLLLLCTATICRPTQSLHVNTTLEHLDDYTSHTEIRRSTGHVFKESIPLLSTRDDVFRHSRTSSEYLHEVVFVIQQRNMDKLTMLLHDVSDPSSINYGKHMTREGVAEMTSNPEAREAVLTYLQSNGASIISETLSAEYITSRAPVGVWEKMFNCEFFLFHFTQHDGEVSEVVRTESYSIPFALAEYVNSVFNTVQMPHQPAGVSRINSRQTESNDGKKHLEGTEDYITPAVLRTAYNVGSKQGSSESTQCVYATVEQHYSPADLAEFQSSFQLAKQTVSISFGDHESDAVCDSNPSNCAEGNLDVQYLMAMSPVSPTTFWYKHFDGFSNWLMTVANKNEFPLVLSMSYGIEERIVTESEFDAFNTQAIKLGAMGVSILVASGDDGAISRRARTTASMCYYAPNFPATNPYVTAVGATSGIETSTTEVACQANNGATITSGGGFSIHYPLPAFQKKAVPAYFTTAAAAGKSPVTGYSTTGRGFPDVSLAGHNYRIYLGNRMESVSGTSAGAPVMAGFLSNVNAARLAAGKSSVGWINPALYANYTLFTKDITSGDNKCAATAMNSVVNCCSQGFNAMTGWDPVTGLGSVDYGKMETFFLTLGNMKIILNPTKAPVASARPSGIPTVPPTRALTMAASKAPIIPGSPTISPTGLPARAPVPIGTPARGPVLIGSPVMTPVPIGSPVMTPVPIGSGARAPVPVGSPVMTPVPVGTGARNPVSIGSPVGGPVSMGSPLGVGSVRPPVPIGASLPVSSTSTLSPTNIASRESPSTVSSSPSRSPVMTQQGGAVPTAPPQASPPTSSRPPNMDVPSRTTTSTSAPAPIQGLTQTGDSKRNFSWMNVATIAVVILTTAGMTAL